MQQFPPFLLTMLFELLVHHDLRPRFMPIRLELETSAPLRPLNAPSRQNARHLRHHGDGRWRAFSLDGALSGLSEVEVSQFEPNRHEPGTKIVMGGKFKEHGEQEGRDPFHMLATRPATAQFISRQLAVRFVSDDPPKALGGWPGLFFDVRHYRRGEYPILVHLELWDSKLSISAKVKTP